MGDVKLFGMLGATLGTNALPILLFLASVQGVALGGAWLLLIRHRPLPAPQADGFVPPVRAIPFGPFLSLAAFEYLFFNSQIRAVMARLIAPSL